MPEAVLAPGARIECRSAEWLVRGLGRSSEELITIYRVQLPVMQQYERDTCYDRNGRIVFTASKGLTGVGFPQRIRPWPQQNHRLGRHRRHDLRHRFPHDHR